MIPYSLKKFLAGDINSLNLLVFSCFFSFFLGGGGGGGGGEGVRFLSEKSGSEGL